jgi:three-Cys-motif partner protein
MSDGIEFAGDEIGYWSEIKLDIVREYASAYSRILTSQRNLTHVYVDAFAGAGFHKAKGSGKFILGSPLNALNVEPPFKEFHLIDLQASKINHLRAETGERPDVMIYEGDCNQVLLNTVLPTIKYESFRRALCLLDPYGLHLDWKVMEMAGQLGTVEIFLNFPTADMNRNVLWRNPSKVSEDQVRRMNFFWGDESWREAAYSSEGFLFGDLEDKQTNDSVANAFQKRLKEVAGFKYVPSPIPMRNSQGAIVYYLFFASPNQTADKIVTQIFDKYRKRGIPDGK